MQVSDTVIQIVRNRFVRCPICGAGWRLDLTNDKELRLIAQAVEAHVQGHKKIAAARTREKDQSNPRCYVDW